MCVCVCVCVCVWVQQPWTVENEWCPVLQFFLFFHFYCSSSVQLSSVQLSNSSSASVLTKRNERNQTARQAGRQAGQHCKLGLNYLLATELALLVITSTTLNCTVLQNYYKWLRLRNGGARTLIFNSVRHQSRAETATVVVKGLVICRRSQMRKRERERERERKRMTLAQLGEEEKWAKELAKYNNKESVGR